MDELISVFRSAGGNQAQGLPVRVRGLEDFSTSPCQVYLFWFRLEPDVHYCRLIRTSLANRPDGEQEVIGPIRPAKALEVLGEVLGWEHWSEGVEDSMLRSMDDSQGSMRENLARSLHEAQRELDRYIVRHARTADTVAHVGNKMASPGGFTWDIYGDPRDLQPARLLARRLGRTLRRKRTEQRQPEPQPIRALGTHIYPHVRVGELPQRTPEELLHGDVWNVWTNFEATVTTQFRARRVVVLRDGYVAIESESVEQATSDLNQMMAAILLSGIDVRAVRPAEVGNAMIDPTNFSIASWSLEVVSMRTATSLFGGSEAIDMEFRERVEVDVLKQAITQAEAVSDDAYLRNLMSFLLEAHTHHESQEYRQSFVMSWLVMESWLDKRWTDQLNTMGVSGKRKARLSEGNRFTAEVKSEVLDLLGHVTPDQLSMITKHRRRRNKVVHDGYNPAHSESEEALQFARELCTAQFQTAVERKEAG